MTNLEDNAAVMALEYLRDYCHRQSCGDKCALIKFCRIRWDGNSFESMEEAVEDFRILCEV